METIKLDAIIIPFHQRQLRPRRVARIARWIADDGYNESYPITLETDRQTLVDGGHRVAAALQTGMEELPYVTTDHPSIQHAIRCNEQGAYTEPHDVFDYAELCWMLSEQGMTGKEIGEKLGWSDDLVSKHKLIKDRLCQAAWNLARGISTTNQESVERDIETVVESESTIVEWFESHFRALLKHLPHIDDIIGAPLHPGYEVIECSLEDFEAGYDYKLGIDVILNFTNGMTSTLQEKFLYTKFRTVTVEYMQNPRSGERGDWFTMKAQYYFVGYDRRDIVGRLRKHGLSYPKISRQLKIPLSKVLRARPGREPSFQDWILLDWNAVQRETCKGIIRWQQRPNMRDGARANFKYVKFSDIPKSCIVASKW